MRQPPRPRFALPFGEDLNDYEFEPLPKPPKKTHRGTRGRKDRPARRRRLEHINLQRKAEYRLRVLQIKKQEWDEQELRWLKMRAAQEVAWLKEYNEREENRERGEAEMKRVRDWFTNELAKEAAKAKARRT